MKTRTLWFSSVKTQDGRSLTWEIYAKEVTMKANQVCEHLSAPVPAVPADEITAPSRTAPSFCCSSLSCVALHMSFA